MCICPAPNARQTVSPVCYPFQATIQFKFNFYKQVKLKQTEKIQIENGFCWLTITPKANPAITEFSIATTTSSTVPKCLAKT